MLLMIDNYDSFTYNLVQYLGELGEDVRVYRNDKISIEQIESLKPTPHRRLAWTVHAERGGYLGRDHEAFRRTLAASGRLPWSSVAGSRIWRRSHQSHAPHAR